MVGDKWRIYSQIKFARDSAIISVGKTGHTSIMGCRYGNARYRKHRGLYTCTTVYSNS